jgi:hypothetical protein
VAASRQRTSVKTAIYSFLGVVRPTQASALAEQAQKISQISEMSIFESLRNE